MNQTKLGETVMEKSKIRTKPSERNLLLTHHALRSRPDSNSSGVNIKIFLDGLDRHFEFRM